jgi:hypothetical protein
VRFQSGRPRRCVEETMVSPYSFLQHEIDWLLAIGQRLRVEYDAIAQPMPPRLIALLRQLGQSSEEGIQRQDSFGRSGDPLVAPSGGAHCGSSAAGPMQGSVSSVAP